MPSVNLIIKVLATKSLKKTLYISLAARIDHALKRLPILLPNSDLELAGWLLLRYCCEVRLAPNYALHTSSWGEPERAPHRRVERSQSIYIAILYITREMPNIVGRA